MNDGKDAYEEGPSLLAWLFPAEMEWCRPVDLGGKDSGIICCGRDSCDYVIKDGITGDSAPIVPHCEWFCSEIGEHIGIPSPPHKIVRMDDGSLVFGSRWLGGLVTPQTGGYWYDKVKEGQIDLSSIKVALSRIYAFDHFIHNEDRHEQNFLVVEQYSGAAIVANDYSRAWLSHGFPLPPPPLPEYNTTVKTRMWLRKYWEEEFIEKDEFLATLERINRIKKSVVERIIENHPPAWLSNTYKSDILSWWGSNSMADRIGIISRAIENGL